MMWHTITYVMFFIIGLFIIVDFYVHFYIWQSRIKIGRINDPEIWKEAIKKRAISWLYDTPTVKLTDNNRLLLWDMINGNYLRPTIQVWQKASLLIGLTDYAVRNNDKLLEHQLTLYVQSLFTSIGTWKIPPKESDWIMLSHAVIRIPWIDITLYHPAFKESLDLLYSLQGEDGTIAYKSHVKEFRFVDTIGFVCPFLALYAEKFKDHAALDLALDQWDLFHQYGMMTGGGIPCHTYHVATKIPVGLFGWGRGLGWYGYGLLELYHSLPENHSRKYEIEAALCAFVKAALPFQHSDGSWSWLLFDSKVQKDSSITAVMGWVLTHLPQSLRTEETTKAAEQCQRYLQKVTRRNGAIDFSQGDTKGIGVYSQTFDVLPFTQGFALRSISGLYRY
jgi:unsaturated rhamnogalacturonyl hydrolase